MNTTIALVADLWSHVGPGLVFAFALPVFLMAFGAIALTMAKHVKGRSRA
jgi:hypothetical protein